MNENSYRKVVLIVVPILTFIIGALVGYLLPHPSGGDDATASSSPSQSAPTSTESASVEDTVAPDSTPTASPSGEQVTMGTAVPQQRQVGDVTVTADAVVQGNPAASVTITTISDMQCGHCKNMHALLLDTYDEYIASGNVKLEAKTVTFLDGYFSWYSANLLALVADVDPEHWAAVEAALFDAQANGQSMTGADYIQLALAAGATIPDDKANQLVAGTLEYGTWVNSVNTAVANTGVNSIPRLYVNGTEVTYTESEQTVTNLKAAVDAALAGS